MVLRSLSIPSSEHAGRAHARTTVRIRKCMTHTHTHTQPSLYTDVCEFYRSDVVDDDDDVDDENVSVNVVF